MYAHYFKSISVAFAENGDKGAKVLGEVGFLQGL